jgi:hypothetical protein
MIEKLIEGVTVALSGISVGDHCSIKISINGAPTTKKKCYKWVNGMMIQVPCDSADVEGTIDY